MPPNSLAPNLCSYYSQPNAITADSIIVIASGPKICIPKIFLESGCTSTLTKPVVYPLRTALSLFLNSNFPVT